MSTTERFFEHRDTFERTHVNGYSVARVSVELCQGDWWTFAYVYAGIGDPSSRPHGSREDARAEARRWIAKIRL